MGHDYHLIGTASLCRSDDFSRWGKCVLLAGSLTRPGAKLLE